MKVLCACGCGEKKEKLDAKGRETRFIFGHGNRGRKFPTLKHSKQFKKGSVPHNKGIEGYTNAGTFKVGHEGLKGESNPNWRGGTSLMRNGYRQIRIDGKKHYEHRLVMERHLGRKLMKEEQVHHKNHDRLDNRISNLEVVSAKQHASYHANVMWGNLTKGVNHGVQ